MGRAVCVTVLVGAMTLGAYNYGLGRLDLAVMNWTLIVPALLGMLPRAR